MPYKDKDELRAYQAAYRKKNKEKIIAYKADYYSLNKESIIKKHAIYNEENKEKRAAYFSAYRALNKDRINSVHYEYIRSRPELRKSICKKYYLNNREKASLYYISNRPRILKSRAEYHIKNPENARLGNHKRRAKKKLCGGKLSKGITEKLMKLQRGKCAVCKKSVKSGHHLDHIYPLSKGGANEDSNIQILCPTCNLSKGAKHPQDFMNSRGFLL